MTNLSFFDDNDRYYNWYHGYTEMRLLPHWNRKMSCIILSQKDFDSKALIKNCDYFNFQFYDSTSTISGEISTKFYGDRFNSNNVIKSIECLVIIKPPFPLFSNKTAKLHLKLEKNPLKGYDNLYLLESFYNPASARAIPIDADSKTFTTTLLVSTAHQTALGFTRKISQDNLNIVQME